MSVELLAVIPFYKRKDQLDRCLTALAQSTYPVTPWIHDNSNENIGFTKAINLGLKGAIAKGSTYALLLNQDCYVFPETVANLVALMEKRPRCAVAGAKQMWARDPNVIVHGGCHEAFPRGRNITGSKSRGDCAVSLPMPWVNGAIVLVRIAALVEIGLLDENMILVGSDSDLCYTARARGWEVWYCAEAECLHEEGATASTREEQFLETMKKDMLYWRDKWLGPNLYARLFQVRPEEGR